MNTYQKDKVKMKPHLAKSGEHKLCSQLLLAEWLAHEILLLHLVQGLDGKQLTEPQEDSQMSSLIQCVNNIYCLVYGIRILVIKKKNLIVYSFA